MTSDLVKLVARTMPDQILKHKGKIVRQRILPDAKSPERKIPKKFWHSKWCFYEIGIGRYGDESFAENVGGVGFFMGNSILQKNTHRI